jgi:hypothetical protein
MVTKQTTSEFQNDSLWRRWLEAVESVLHKTIAWRFKWILWGMLFAVGRKTISSWIRAAEVQGEYQRYYYAVSTFGRQAQKISEVTLDEICRVLGPIAKEQGFIEIVLDDSPTKRYGPKIEGAGWHHNPTPGKTDAKLCYGHSWVSISWTARHPEHGTIAFPLRGLLYVRKKEIPEVQTRYPNDNWEFKTKLELGKSLVLWVKEQLSHLDLPIRVVADGGYAKAPFVKVLLKESQDEDVQLEIITRLRCDAVLFDLPPIETEKRPGPHRIYGVNRLSLKKRAGQTRGWQELECVTYGKKKVKQYKTFLATTKLIGGMVRIVIIREPNGSWVPLMSTNVNLSVKEIIESYSDRYSIEENYQELKQTWQMESPQVRNLYANIGVFHLCVWMYSMVQLWSWDKKHDDLCDRSTSPWDDPTRRPSHADRCRALRRKFLHEKLNHVLPATPKNPKFQQLLKWLRQLAT